MTAWMLPAAMVGSSVLGGLLSNNAMGNAGDQTREASRRSIEMARNASLINSANMAPFIGTGMGALQELFGYSPGGTTQGLRFTNSGAPGGTNVSTLLSTGDKWKSPTTIGQTSYAKTGTGIDPTGGAGKYTSGLESLVNNASTPGVNTQSFIDQLKGYGTNFKFDENNPAFTQQLATSTRAINQALAARGMYNSRAGLNVLDESNRNLIASEYDKQYQRGYSNIMDLFGMTSQQDEALLNRNNIDFQRQYGGMMDLFKMSNTLGQQKYGSLLDAVKIGTGAAASAGGLGNQGASNMTSAYGQMSNAALVSGQNNASLYSGLGAMPLNFMILQQLLGGNKSQIPYIPAA